jgi:hypothetical protein
MRSRQILRLGENDIDKKVRRPSPFALEELISRGESACKAEGAVRFWQAWPFDWTGLMRVPIDGIMF